MNHRKFKLRSTVLAPTLTAVGAVLKGVAEKAHDTLFSLLSSQGLILGVNAFNKEERIQFDNLLAGFEDALTISREVATFNTDQQMMERTNDIIWRPMPYIVPSYDGMDQTANFNDKTQLSVPATIGFKKSVPWVLTATELRDMLQNDRLKDAANQRLSSDINVAVTNVACLQGSLVVKRTGAIQGFDDVAACEAIAREQGVTLSEAAIAIHVREYNSMAANLANRAQLQGKTETAYDEALIGRIAAFKAFKADYTYRLTAAAGVTVTVNGANQRYVPKATSTASTGETANVDNRWQNLTVTVTSGTIKVGDAFTIAGVNAVHQITKGDTGQLKTFRVAAIVSGGGGSGVIQITPPIVAADSAPTQAELQYKNVTATPANGAAITWLNTAAANVQPFWTKESIEILPGRYAVPADAGAAVMRGTTKQGYELVMQKQYDVKTMKTFLRVDTMFGVVNRNTEMNGILLLAQT